MPESYDKVQLGQLVSAIWSKYLSLQGGDVETQRQLLSKDKEIFQKEREISDLASKLKTVKENNPKVNQVSEFEAILKSGKLVQFIQQRDHILTDTLVSPEDLRGASEARAFGLVEPSKKNEYLLTISQKGREFFQWYLLHGE